MGVPYSTWNSKMQIYVDSIIHRKKFSLVTGYLCFELRICEIFVFFQYLLLHAAHVDAAPTLPFCPPFTFFLSPHELFSVFFSRELALFNSTLPQYFVFYYVSDRRSNVFQVLVESRFPFLILYHVTLQKQITGTAIKQRFGDNYFSISL